MRILVFPAGAGVGGADEGAHVLTTTILGEDPDNYTRRGASLVVKMTILRETEGRLIHSTHLENYRSRWSRRTGRRSWIRRISFWRPLGPQFVAVTCIY